MEQLLAAGALDVFTTPIGMKKSRPGVMLTVLCRLEDREPLVQAMFRHTTTLGVREHLCQSYTLARSQQERQTPWGPVRVKTASGWGVTRQKPEYDDLSRIAKEHSLPLQAVAEQLEK